MSFFKFGLVHYFSYVWVRMRIISVIFSCVFLTIGLGVFGQVPASKRSSYSKVQFFELEDEDVDVEVNNSLAEDTYKEDPEAAIELVQSSLIFAKFNADTTQIIECYSLLGEINAYHNVYACLLYTSPSPRDGATSRMPSSA